MQKNLFVGSPNFLWLLVVWRPLREQTVTWPQPVGSSTVRARVRLPDNKGGQARWQTLLQSEVVPTPKSAVLVSLSEEITNPLLS